MARFSLSSDFAGTFRLRPIYLAGGARAAVSGLRLFCSRQGLGGATKDELAVRGLRCGSGGNNDSWQHLAATGQTSNPNTVQLGDFDGVGAAS